MAVDEGGTSKGDLSAYVSRVYSERAQQKAQQERTLPDRFAQQTALVQNHLLQLAASADELLVKFNVRELLEEARSIYLAKAEEAGGEYLLYPTRWSRPFLSDTDFSDYTVYETRPSIYQQIVLNPQPRESFQFGSEVVDLNTLSVPDNFRRLIPRLENYGFVLQTSWVAMARSLGRLIEWEEQGYLIPNPGPFGGGVYIPGRKRFDVRYDEKYVWVTKSLCVEAETTESDCVLKYSHQLQRESLDKKGSSVVHIDGQVSLKPELVHTNRQDGNKQFLFKPAKISADAPVESLRKLIGDDIIHELDGGYKQQIAGFLA